MDSISMCKASNTDRFLIVYSARIDAESPLSIYLAYISYTSSKIKIFYISNF